ncbi:type II secretion system pilot lipoprotein GspS [Serratia quinivorans]|uniref:type II secretion system pilot lipoprotein GspS n=1 Tax=Serratia quinivorans TaxID=137545 RepID=UPI00217906ED|nr:type II secretion system pilot lipoprotein GspS [Serratia quinivorans]CAI0736966.1 Lipoprotein outS precursor [Serratia quinivorans]CAI0763677.1 Lipoprotein outS precursor [Serratia quinivorans]CAI1671345.1 Lipoprotein outS precursor [Serratia quinivorans]CAI2052102.1 Lipoprotein outS precursor [Serratia quinivorans]CAI2099841.1 Lipoprotein outS precursor [Serratia quinivorans]
MLTVLRTSVLGAMALVFLAGCQQTTHQPSPPLQAQLDKLSAMLAGSHFLRQNCGRTDIPDDVKLQRTAMRVAEHRGWDTHAAGYQQLPALAQARYLAILEDRQLLTDKCAAMNNRTANFVAAAKSDQEDYME